MPLDRLTAFSAIILIPEIFPQRGHVNDSALWEIRIVRRGGEGDGVCVCARAYCPKDVRQLHIPRKSTLHRRAG